MHEQQLMFYTICISGLLGTNIYAPFSELKFSL